MRPRNPAISTAYIYIYYANIRKKNSIRKIISKIYFQIHGNKLVAIGENKISVNNEFV